MNIPILVRDHQYYGDTLSKWKSVWASICEMCYNGRHIQEEIITTGGYFQVDDEVMMDTGDQDQASFYGQRYAINDEQITLDYTWKEYSQKAGPGFVPRVVPELTRLHVPACLFYSLGVDSWFSHSFPNCKVTFWES